jgi:uncharacterized protein (TIGR03437 family)
MKTNGAILSFAALLLTSAGLCLAQPSINSGGIVNGASFAAGQPITPGSLVSIFGTSLASKAAGADSIPLSTTGLGGVSVEFVNGSNSYPAPMLAVLPGSLSQLNLQVPWELVPNGTTATVNVIVNNNGTKSAPSPVTVGPFSPGVFASNGLAVAVNFEDGTLAWPVGAVPGLTTHPAKIGGVLVVYATGLGAVDHTPADGANAGATLTNALTKPQVLIGGVSADVLFAGLSPQFVGVNQLNITVPNVAPGNSVSFQIMVGGITSPAATTIAVSQ